MKEKVLAMSYTASTMYQLQRTDIGKYSFVNRSITDWNQLPEGVIGTSHSKTHIFKMRVRKV